MLSFPQTRLYMAQYVTESELTILNDVLRKKKAVLKNSTALSALNRKFAITTNPEG